ncbi:DUF4314 domain-containing protein [Desulfoscipio gibsoniae]
MFFDHKKIQPIKEQYPGGTCIRLHSMSGEADMPSEPIGTEDFVNDAGQLQMTWDNGRSLALVPGKESFPAFSQPKQSDLSENEAKQFGMKME